MSMKKFGDLMASTGEYTDSQGRKAKRWTRCGVLMKDDVNGSMSIKLDCVPVSPTWSGWLAVRNVETAGQEETACQD
jgi:hypothetical protein